MNKLHKTTIVVSGMLFSVLLVAVVKFHAGCFGSSEPLLLYQSGFFSDIQPSNIVTRTVAQLKEKGYTITVSPEIQSYQISATNHSSTIHIRKQNQNGKLVIDWLLWTWKRAYRITLTMYASNRNEEAALIRDIWSTIEGTTGTHIAPPSMMENITSSDFFQMRQGQTFRGNSLADIEASSGIGQEELSRSGCAR